MFSDIVMPGGMNGIHLAQEVSEHYPAIRVLLTTGYSDMAAAAETRYPDIAQAVRGAGAGARRARRHDGAERIGRAALRGRLDELALRFWHLVQLGCHSGARA